MGAPDDDDRSSDPLSDPDESTSTADPAAAGVAHLQRAGREFVSAARSFLDAVEEVVEDRTRLGELAESFTGFLGELSEAARGGSTPWGAPVRTAPRAAEPEPTDAPRSADAAEAGAVTDPADASPSPTSAGPDSADDRPQPGARVRRIPVD